jgi:hypothetical protein
MCYKNTCICALSTSFLYLTSWFWYFRVVTCNSTRNWNCKGPPIPRLLAVTATSSIAVVWIQQDFFSVATLLTLVFSFFRGAPPAARLPPVIEAAVLAVRPLPLKLLQPETSPKLLAATASEILTSTLHCRCHCPPPPCAARTAPDSTTVLRRHHHRGWRPREAWWAGPVSWRIRPWARWSHWFAQPNMT